MCPSSFKSKTLKTTLWRSEFKMEGERETHSWASHPRWFRSESAVQNSSKSTLSFLSLSKISNNLCLQWSVRHVALEECNSLRSEKRLCLYQARRISVTLQETLLLWVLFSFQIPWLFYAGHPFCLSDVQHCVQKFTKLHVVVLTSLSKCSVDNCAS